MRSHWGIDRADISKQNWCSECGESYVNGSACGCVDNLIESRNLIINDLLSSDKRWWEFWK